MSEKFQDALSGIARYKPVPWEMIPDLGLYMDQVITFISNAYAPLYGEDMHSYISPAMINNYVKSKLIPRPTGKKYNREQIALLTMIVALKQVSSMEDIRRMIVVPEGESVEYLYTTFCQRFQWVIQALQNTEDSAFGSLATALDFAILSSGFRAGCEAVLKSEE